MVGSALWLGASVMQCYLYYQAGGGLIARACYRCGLLALKAKSAAAAAAAAADAAAAAAAAAGLATAVNKPCTTTPHNYSYYDNY